MSDNFNWNDYPVVSNSAESFDWNDYPVVHPEKTKESAVEYATRKTGRGLRHASAAISGLQDIPRGVVDAASTLIRNKPFFDPSRKTHAQESVERIDTATKGKLKPRDKNEEAWDMHAPAILPALATLNPLVISGALTASKAADIIHDAEENPDSAFYGLSPREKLMIITIAGGGGMGGVGAAKRGIKHVARKADKGTLASIAEMNKGFKEAGKSPIQTGISDYFPSDKLTLSGGASSGRIKKKHNQLSEIIKGEESAAHLGSFFDEHGMRKGAPSYVERPHIAFGERELIPHKGEMKYIQERMEIPVKHITKETPTISKPRSEWTQQDFLEELNASAKSHETSGHGPAHFEVIDQRGRFKNSPLANALEKFREKPTVELRHPVKSTQEVFSSKKQIPVSHGRMESDLLEPQYHIPSIRTGKKLVSSHKYAPDISLGDVKDALINPKGHKIIKEFSHSLPDTASRADAARSLLQSLSPEGNFMEIAQKYNELPGLTRTEITNMFYPHERNAFKGAMHYANRTMSKLSKEAGEKVKMSRFGTPDVSYALATKGLSVPAKIAYRHGVPAVKKLLSNLSHSKGLENIVRKYS